MLVNLSTNEGTDRNDPTFNDAVYDNCKCMI